MRNENSNEKLQSNLYTYTLSLKDAKAFVNQSRSRKKHLMDQINNYGGDPRQILHQVEGLYQEKIEKKKLRKLKNN
jgi:hypothetical protein